MVWFRMLGLRLVCVVWARDLEHTAPLMLPASPAKRAALTQPAHRKKQTTLNFGQTTARSAVTAKAYLAAPPFYGASRFENKEAVKALGANEWNPKRKLWGTKSRNRLTALIDSGLWTPTDLAPSAIAELLVLLKPQPVPASTQRCATDPVAAEASEPADEETILIGALGITRAAVAASPLWPELGPLTGLSKEGRLLRWLDILKYHVQSDFEHDPQTYFSPTLLKPHQDRRIAEQVAEWNARAAD